MTHLCVNEQSARKPSGDVVIVTSPGKVRPALWRPFRGFGLKKEGAIVQLVSSRCARVLRQGLVSGL